MRNRTKKAGHTPGPWVEAKRKSGDGEELIVGSGEKVVASINGFNIFNTFNHKPEAEANARLIAASVDLLEAARAGAELLEFIEPQVKGGYSPDGALAKLRAAIAKAEGRGGVKA